MIIIYYCKLKIWYIISMIIIIDVVFKNKLLDCIYGIIIQLFLVILPFYTCVPMYEIKHIGSINS